MDVVVREIKPSARRHGISEARILQAIAESAGVYATENPLTGDDDLLLLLGHDQAGVPLEVVARELEDGSLVVFHAMVMRPAYRDLLRELEGRR